MLGCLTGQNNRRANPISTLIKADLTVEAMLELITASLDDDKAQDLITIDLKGKTSMADFLVIASGASARHVSAMAERLAAKFKDAGQGRVLTEGAAQGDWVLLDAGEVVVHLFRPEVRAFYNIEAMWGAEAPRLPEASAVS